MLWCLHRYRRFVRPTDNPMKKDVRLKHRSGLICSRKNARQQLVDLLKLSQELETVYQTYPKLRAVVGKAAWESMGDYVYRQILLLHLNPADADAQKAVSKNISRLEDISAASLIRDDIGLRDILSRVLLFRISNNLVHA